MKIKQIQNNPFQENTYVVYDEVSMEAAIVDCGALFPQEEERIEAFVNDNNLKVKYILNTHLHLDHCFGNHWAAGRYGVLPMAHADDETLLARMGGLRTVGLEKTLESLLESEKIKPGLLPCPSPSPRACSNSCPLSR